MTAPETPTTSERPPEKQAKSDMAEIMRKYRPFLRAALAELEGKISTGETT